jgi:hypothetical protein
MKITAKDVCGACGCTVDHELSDEEKGYTIEDLESRGGRARNTMNPTICIYIPIDGTDTTCIVHASLAENIGTDRYKHRYICPGCEKRVGDLILGAGIEVL